MPKNYNLYLKGYVGDWNFSVDMVNAVLDKHKDKEVCVLIDSTGGRVDSALSIAALFKIHGNVNCHYVGMNASAATIASMGAKHISIDANALFLVHKCMTVVFEWDYMNADELDAHIKQLEKVKKDNETIDACIAGMYASRCKKPKEDLLALMKEGAWLTAKQALEWGFVDEITDDPEDAAPVITDAVADAFAKEGIPMPPVHIKKDSFLERVLQFFSSLYKPTPEATKPMAATTKSKMSKIFAKLSALLETDVALENDCLSLSEEQADRLEASLSSNEATLADLNRQLAERDETIAALNSQLSALKNEPAADTNPAIPASSTNSSQDAINIDKLCDAILANF